MNLISNLVFQFYQKRGSFYFIAIFGLKIKLWIVLNLFEGLQAVVKSFAKPAVTSQKLYNELLRYIQLLAGSNQLVVSFCKTMSGFAKFISEDGKLRIAPLLLGAAQIIGCVISSWKMTLNNKYKRIIFLKYSQVL